MSCMKLSVGTQLAIVTVAVLLAVTTLLVLVLAAEERRQTLEHKRAAATTVTDLFAASAAAGVVFKDEDAVRAMLDHLHATDDVVAAAVFELPQPGDDALVGRGRFIGSFGEAIDFEAARGAVFDGEPGHERLLVTQQIFDSDHKAVGVVRIVFSLEREYASAAQTQWNLALGGLFVMLVTAGLLIGFARVWLVRPLMNLVQTAKHIEEGELLKSRAPETGNVEVATLARALNSMGDAITDRERQLRGELQVAADLQISILPKLERRIGVEPAEREARMAAIMKPATEVGGDYYDIIKVSDGYWLGIGDVSGHGLGAGVIMLMIQSAVAALVAARPDITPCEVECAVNRVLYENIRTRMGRRDHATLSILRYHDDGRVRFAGAHEDIIVYRAASGTVETFETPGTWVGAKKDVASATVESTLQLAPNDVMVLYTDGITEAKRSGARQGEQFGIERLIEVIRRSASSRASPSEMCDAIAEAVNQWTDKSEPFDDVSIVVMKHPDFLMESLSGGSHPTEETLVRVVIKERLNFDVGGE